MQCRSRGKGYSSQRYEHEVSWASVHSAATTALLDRLEFDSMTPDVL